jgi:hypothetical protein
MGSNFAANEPVVEFTLRATVGSRAISEVLRVTPVRRMRSLSLLACRGQTRAVPENVGLEQGRLRADVEVVRSYGAVHPEAWVELRFENEPTVRIVALFSGPDLSVHESVLHGLVSHPGRLEVRSSPWPQTRLEEIRSHIHEMATSSAHGLFEGWGIGGGRVSVTLRADAVRVAAELRGRYGEAVDVTVGFLHYPECGVPPSWGAANSDRLQPTHNPLPQWLHVVVDHDLRVRSGENLSSTIRLVNEGGQEVVAHTNGQITAPVVDPKSNEVVGGYSGAQVAPLIRFPAPPNDSVEIPLLVGTASRLPRLGYTVPPGEWAIEVAVGLGVDGTFSAPPMPLIVVA